MTVVKNISINPEMLRWLRLEAGLTLDQLAKAARLDKDELKAWEEGDGGPNLGSLEKLSNYFSRPVSFFLRPKPPAHTKLPTDRRMLPGRRGVFTYDTKLAVRRALRLKETASDLITEIGMKAKGSFRKLSLQDDAEEASAALRAKLGVTWEQQVRTGPGQIFNLWRTALEQRYLLLVLRMEFPWEDARGFAIGGGKHGVVVVNVHEKVYARNFTLFHELGHLHLNNEGICLTDERTRGSGVDSQVERWCNTFSASFLLPKAEFERESRIDGIVRGDVEDLKDLSNRVKVSGHAILIRLRELDYIDDDRCDELLDSFKRYMDGNEGGGFGRNTDYSKVIVNRIGRLLPSLVLEGVNRKIVSYGQISDLLGTKLKYLSGIKRQLEG